LVPEQDPKRKWGQALGTAADFEGFSMGTHATSSKSYRWKAWGRLNGVYPLVMTNIAIENTPFIVDLPIQNGGSFYSDVSLPEGNILN